MRVIAGVCKGKPLKPVPGHSTRPTADKVKEAVFNRIGPFFEGGAGVDLYAGSGGLGVEALSRGLSCMIFVDRDPKAIKIIHHNVRICGFAEEADVFRNDAYHALKVAEKRGLRFKVIFLDPPYFQQKLARDLHKIDQGKLLTGDGRIVVEHHEDAGLAEDYGDLSLESVHTYGGKIVISIYRREQSLP